MWEVEASKLCSETHTCTHTCAHTHGDNLPLCSGALWAALPCSPPEQVPGTGEVGGLIQVSQEGGAISC